MPLSAAVINNLQKIIKIKRFIHKGRCTEPAGDWPDFFRLVSSHDDNWGTITTFYKVCKFQTI